MLASSSDSSGGLGDSVELCSFDYAIIRVAPRVEREEFVNVGAIVFCASQRFLDARIELDESRLQVLAALAPGLCAEALAEQLASIPLICAGRRGAGPIGALGQTARFHWLVAPRSTIIQTSPVHCGLCHDPSAALEKLLVTMVRGPKS